MIVGFWIAFFSGVFGTDLNLEQILSARAMSISYSFGWPPLLAYLLVLPPW